MKKLIKWWLMAALLAANASAALAQKVKIEEIKEQCSGLDFNKRVRLTVSSFKVATPKASGQFGTELGDMLSNALQNVNCFNVLLSAKDMGDLNEEMALEQAGSTAESSKVKPGAFKGAQVVVMGKITEYSEGNSSVSPLPGIRIGSNKAHIGFIIQLINLETREIIDSKSIDVEGKSSGFSGGSILGVPMIGTMSNKAVADAVEKGLIEAVEFIASRKDKMPLPAGNSGVAQAKIFNAGNCALLAGGHAPKIMVILPEFHISRRIPDPAGETEIIRQFVEAGFPVVDAAMYASISGSAKFDEAAKDPMKAIALGKQFGADVVIYGEAFSQLADVQPARPQISCRARVEVKAVKTSDATVVAAHGLEAAGLDNGEFVAAKAGLRNAGHLVADYLLEQFCTKSLSFGKAGSAGGANTTVTEIDVTNADYAKLKSLVDVLATKGKVLDKSSSGGVAHIRFEHPNTLDVAEFIDGQLRTKFSIGDFSNGKMTLQAK